MGDTWSILLLTETGYAMILFHFNDGSGRLGQGERTVDFHGVKYFSMKTPSVRNHWRPWRLNIKKSNLYIKTKKILPEAVCKEITSGCSEKNPKRKRFIHWVSSLGELLFD